MRAGARDLGGGIMRWLRTLLEWVAGALLCLMVVDVFLQVVSRYTGLFFIPWTEEVARLLFLWVVWLGAAAAMMRGGHIAFDFVVNRLPTRLRRSCVLVVDVGVGLFLIILARFGYEVAQSQANTSFLTIEISVKYTYLSAVAGSALMMVGLAGSLQARLRASQGSQGADT